MELLTRSSTQNKIEASSTKPETEPLTIEATTVDWQAEPNQPETEPTSEWELHQKRASS